MQNGTTGTEHCNATDSTIPTKYASDANELARRNWVGGATQALIHDEIISLVCLFAVQNV